MINHQLTVYRSHFANTLPYCGFLDVRNLKEDSRATHTARIQSALAIYFY